MCNFKTRIEEISFGFSCRINNKIMLVFLVAYMDATGCLFLLASASYCLGRLDGDCWFLYTLNHAENNNLVGVGEPDQTLEILMSNLDPEAMAHFQLFDEFGNEKSTEMVTKVH